ncbi:MAG: polysaccharide deacetylase family protein [Chthoniobacterales bacterium]|nr:polysaccharide deacetylase family protein [Chthoniobacterales bacterium]
MQKTEDLQEGGARRALVVSIHDVSPRTRSRTEDILADLESVGLPRTSLLVVPDHHHHGLVCEDAPFTEWLRAACSRGHEAVLHGYYHLRENKTSDGPLKRLVTRSYTAGEGEFYDLDKASARELLLRGRAAVEGCGVKVTGFIAPAWLLGGEAEEAVREAGFHYTTRIATVSDFVSNAVHRSRSQVWSVRAAWRRSCSLGWNALLFSRTRNVPLARIGIHPPDWEYPQIRKQILRLVVRALALRAPMTYADWLVRQRTEAC